MTLWIMEPRDPLLVRDGRPFGPDPGARATSLPFPFPSTLAGGIRSRAGVDENGIFQYIDRNEDTRQHLQRLKRLRVRGPLLVELAGDSGDIKLEEEQEANGSKIPVPQYFLPAPSDALLLPVKNEATVRIQQLLPLELPPGAATDLDRQNLLFVGPTSDGEPEKPYANAPAYWSWKHFNTWLLKPSELAGTDLLPAQLGLRGLERDRRQHVSIDSDKEIAKDGTLFETSGLEFTTPGSGKQRLSSARRLALALAAEDNEYEIHPGLTGFGGERRLSTWRKSSMELPKCSKELEEAIVAASHCRLLLLTPACFQQGYLPQWLQEEAAHYGVTPGLKAIAVQRPRIVSGWDLELRRPKPSRRLVSAGTVLFLSLQGQPEALREWIRSTWMQCISDKEEDRIDGFGLAILGTWSGIPLPMGRGSDR
ncbi:MAG TPA: type III-B CRISPR module-associated protein Cmr3 [Ktedonobacteraceae bacterium]|nr:type III-B CRISPR module-associated protein Cmr3 [Ktedonobacteraceae bacterium]